MQTDQNRAKVLCGVVAGIPHELLMHSAQRSNSSAAQTIPAPTPVTPRDPHIKPRQTSQQGRNQ
jgi:hypothetical protein